MSWVEEKLHASDLIRQLSGVDDAETMSCVPPKVEGAGTRTGESSRQNPASPSFWGKRSPAQPTPDRDSREPSEPIVEPATVGGRTPRSLAEDLWEEQPLIKDGILAKVR